MYRKLKEVFWEAKYDKEMEDTLRKLNFRISCIITSIIGMILHITIYDSIGHFGLTWKEYCNWKIWLFIYVIAGFAISYMIIILNNILAKDIYENTEEFFVRKFGKYGRVVSKKDWKRIKKHTKKEEYVTFFRKSMHKCYYYEAWTMASYIEEAELMCCSVIINEKRIAKTVILKDNCIYDLTNHIHFDYDTYIQAFAVETYSILPAKLFLNQEPDKFKAWCKKNNVQCRL